MKNKCQRCPERSTLHITEVEEDGYRELHLCFKCAQKYLQESEVSSSDPVVAAGLAGLGERVHLKKKCPACGLTFQDFRGNGRLGCPQDYVVFRDELKPLLEHIHGALGHVGKMPRRVPTDSESQHRMIQLRQELQQAVAVEDYEKAARLRDSIGRLEQGAAAP